MLSAILIAMVLTEGEPVRDRTPSQIDFSRIETCLHEAETPQSCVGVVETACYEEPGGYSTHGIMECGRREYEIWNGRMEQAYADLLFMTQDRNQQARHDALQSAQTLWTEYRAMECEQRALTFEGGSMMGVIRSGCTNELTAFRAIALERQRDGMSR
ncbi:lysozyme inhibitor LprI family protein [Oceanicaulis sp. LC35]|uniref:lysozyme inhibitor LprI family protein n=1 Tax=Oceanicaulis sp. LC35 TaxID=3349635 RepID=UPI003F855D27